MWKHYIIGFSISLGAIWLFLRYVDLGQMGQALAQMHLVYLLPSTALYILHYVVRTLRWRYLMRPVARVPFRPLFAAMLIGFLGNNLLPAHLGELVRAYVLGRSQGVNKSATFATIVLERVYDGLTVLFLLLVVMVFMDLPQGRVSGSFITIDHLRSAGWLGLAFFAGLLVLLQAFRWQKERALAVCRFCLKPLPRRVSDSLLNILDAFAEGLTLSRASDLGFIALYSLGVWVCLGLWAWSLFPAFDINLGIMTGVLLEVVVALALLIPSAPASLGTFHLAAVATLAFMGAPAGVAGSCAMALWLVHFVITNLLGIYYMWRLGLKWSVLAGKGD